MTSYMLTVFTLNVGRQDIQVDNAEGIQEAIRIAEKATGARVSHGRGGVGSLFEPAIIIDAKSGSVQHVHEGLATTSTQIITNPRAVEMREALLSNRAQ